MKPLSEKVALVTGGSRGIGAATARRLAHDGAHIAISYRNSADAANDLVEELRSLGVQAEAFQADAADPDAVAQLIKDVAERFGRLDILVNNAGVYLTAPVSDETDESYDQTMDTNVRAVFAAVRAAGEVLAENGRIITIGSVAGLRGFPGASVYGASKAAVAAMSRSWAREFGDRGITVNVVHPGPVDTDMNPANGDFAEMQAGATALGRFGKAEEVAATVAFFARPDAAYVTGAELNVDGGMAA